MGSTALAQIHKSFVKSPSARWAALVSSIGAAVTYALLLLLLYLFVDLLVWRGEIPTYAQLSATRKREFADEWAGRSDADRAEAVARLGWPVLRAKRLEARTDEDLKPLAKAQGEEHLFADEWEARWQSGVYLALRDRVNQAAADNYLPPPGWERTDKSENVDPEARPQFGILSLVVRERNRWTGPVLGWLASWNKWTWAPGPKGSANVPYLTGLFVLAFGLAAVRGVLVNALAYLSAAVTLDAVTRLRRAVYFHTYRLGSLTMQTLGTAEVADLLTRRVEEIGDAIQARFTSAVRYRLLVVFLVGLIVLVNFWLALSFLALAALVWLVGGQVAAHFRREGRIGERQAAATLALLSESMALFRLVKCFQMERFNQARVERQLTESGRANWRRLRGTSMAAPLLGSVVLVTGVALLYLAARGVLAGGFSVAGLAVMAVALVSLAVPIARLFDHALKVRRGHEAADAILEFLERRGEAAEAADAEFLPGLTTRMEFRHVTLNDPATGRRILEDVTFAVPAGASIAIVGQNAAEKHALVSMIPRFLDPTSGEVRIEDKNIRWVTHESLRTQVALVMQDDLTFTDTAANNIGVGDPSHNLPQIIEAAKLAHAHQFIEKLPFGYETLVGNGGHSLTPGERFRIALARALLRDPSILIIEEPTGPVDEDTLALFDDTLARVSGGRTVIFLAQRLSTLRNVDRVFLLKNGQVEADGAHDELWKSNDSYRRLQILADATATEHPALKTDS
ncbi:ABC transporter ATP-binding protein [Gemmata sp. G18]|uniref:ABC transporter ATP-binding protein n=1 Tax=Gemmata palustris TaxID=2822762 RepID=A0ABS5BKU0_9BACT|nr:ABC transporter ATP-binding protein [Gemmata palustris]MBP3954321.1 ABC transporter ATP-binding protein [Gemmata palustris]